MRRFLRQSYKRIVPQQLRDMILIQRRAPLWRRAGVVFIHIPKNGGTSINTALYGRFMGHVRLRDLERHAPAEIASLPVCAVTRNPWDRALSAYSFVRAGDRMQDGARISNPERYAIPEFESFERFVLEWLPRQDLSAVDNVFRLQTEYIRKADGTIRLDFMGRLEDMAAVEAYLSGLCGRPVRIQETNKSRPVREYRSAYSDRSAEMIARIYKDDIELLKYEFD